MPDGKTLYLIRHAEAAGMSSGQRDFERPLNARGEQDAMEMGQRLKARSIVPDTLISSPALRAVQTSELIATEIGFPVSAIVFHKSIYEAAVADLIEIIQSLDDDLNSVMIIGHNPSIGWLISQLSDKHIANIPTGAIATLSIASNHWKATDTATTELLEIDHPRK